MKKAGVAELKKSLSEYLAAVKAGGEVLVTERGHPIARLVPVPARTGTPAQIRQLVRSGLVRPPHKRLDEDFWRLPRPMDRDAAVLNALLAERKKGQ